MIYVYHLYTPKFLFTSSYLLDSFYTARILLHLQLPPTPLLHRVNSQLMSLSPHPPKERLDLLHSSFGFNMASPRHLGSSRVSPPCFFILRCC
jgi:hypothetical protein